MRSLSVTRLDCPKFCFYFGQSWPTTLGAACYAFLSSGRLWSSLNCFLRFCSPDTSIAISWPTSRPILKSPLEFLYTIRR